MVHGMFPDHAGNSALCLWGDASCGHRTSRTRRAAHRGGPAGGGNHSTWSFFHGAQLNPACFGRQRGQRTACWSRSSCPKQTQSHGTNCISEFKADLGSVEECVSRDARLSGLLVAFFFMFGTRPVTSYAIRPLGKPDYKPVCEARVRTRRCRAQVGTGTMHETTQARTCLVLIC